MRNGIIFTALSIALLVTPAAEAGLFGNKDSVGKQRTDTTEMREDVLERLYEEKPSVEATLGAAAGYAVFSNTGVNLLLVSTANGSGIAHDNESGEDVYMKMFSAGGGIGLGVKKFSAVFVFHDRDAFDQFVEKGWNFTGQADAAATTDAKGENQIGAEQATIGLNEGVSAYQMTEKGLALQVTLQGTKYWQDEDLN